MASPQRCGVLELLPVFSAHLSFSRCLSCFPSILPSVHPSLSIDRSVYLSIVFVTPSHQLLDALLPSNLERRCTPASLIVVSLGLRAPLLAPVQHPNSLHLARQSPCSACAIVCGCGAEIRSWKQRLPRTCAPCGRGLELRPAGVWSVCGSCTRCPCRTLLTNFEGPLPFTALCLWQPVYKSHPYFRNYSTLVARGS